MSKIRLSPRLAAVADLVPQGSTAIDVGTDHGMIPVWLVQNERCPHVLATDIQAASLKKAASLIERTGTQERIQLFQTDGLKGISPGAGDTVILAGMGGESMVSILSGAPWLREKGRLLILQPQSKRDVLRQWLIENGYQITGEYLAGERGRIYALLTAQGGMSPAYSPAELHLGLTGQISRQPLFHPWLTRLRALAAKAAPYDDQAAELMKEFDEMEKRACTDDNGT